MTYFYYLHNIYLAIQTAVATHYYYSDADSQATFGKTAPSPTLPQAKNLTAITATFHFDAYRQWQQTGT